MDKKKIGIFTLSVVILDHREYSHFRRPMSLITSYMSISR